MLDKYILVNPEKYNASFKQSMSTGKFFFEFSIKASSKKELFDEIEEIIQGLTKIANKYNKEQKKKVSPEPPSQIKNDNIKGLS